MITNLMKIGCVILLLAFVLSCQQNKADKYIFFLHNRFLEEHKLEELHPKYGRTEYVEILEKFRDGGFQVISEQREGNVNAREYALKIVGQIDSLIDQGVPPQSITIIGTSKGGYIAQYVSTIADNSDLNFVFLASFSDSDIANIPSINYCGNILTIYEKSDPFGVSAMERFKTSSCDIGHFQEIELNTGLQHGFIFKALDEWISPSIQWALGNYALIDTIGTIYKSTNLKIPKLERTPPQNIPPTH